MRISILTLFPEMVSHYFNHSMAARAISNGHLKIEVINIRDFSLDKHKRVDDTPFGGGAGMLMTPQPLFDAIEHVKKDNRDAKVIYLSPCGITLDNTVASSLALEGSLIFLCGHYEGIDQRVVDELVDIEMSIGDYVLTGGELPALVTIDAIMRFLPGVLGASNVHEDESFEDSLLEYPQYTRPSDYRGLNVPEVLLSGHHANIKRWQRNQRLKITKERRPDLLEHVKLDKADIDYLKDIDK